MASIYIDIGRYVHYHHRYIKLFYKLMFYIKTVFYTSVTSTKKSRNTQIHTLIWRIEQESNIRRLTLQRIALICKWKFIVLDWTKNIPIGLFSRNSVRYLNHREHISIDERLASDEGHSYWHLLTLYADSPRKQDNKTRASGSFHRATCSQIQTRVHGKVLNRTQIW